MAGKRPSAIVTYQPGSTDYLFVPITNEGQPAADLPSSIEFAFVPTGTALDEDDATWYAATADDDGAHAKLRIGPYENGAEPGTGTFDLYVRITAELVRPVLKAGRVAIL